MRNSVPGHRLSIDLAAAWTADAMDPATAANVGLFVRSLPHGVYFNVRRHEGGGHPADRDGLLALLREQGWASPPFDEWSCAAGPLIVAGGTFETTGMGGEVVLEVFVTDGHTFANLAGPGERATIAAVTAAVRDLASSVRFE